MVDSVQSQHVLIRRKFRKMRRGDAENDTKNHNFAKNRGVRAGCLPSPLNPLLLIVLTVVIDEVIFGHSVSKN